MASQSGGGVFWGRGYRMLRPSAVSDDDFEKQRAKAFLSPTLILCTQTLIKWPQRLFSLFYLCASQTDRQTDRKNGTLIIKLTLYLATTEHNTVERRCFGG